MRVMHRVLPVGIEDLAHRHHLGRVRDVVAQEGALHAEACAGAERRQGMRQKPPPWSLGAGGFPDQYSGMSSLLGVRAAFRGKKPSNPCSFFNGCFAKFQPGTYINLLNPARDSRLTRCQIHVLSGARLARNGIVLWHTRRGRIAC